MSALIQADALSVGATIELSTPYGERVFGTGVPTSGGTASWHTVVLAPGTPSWIAPLTGTVFATWAGGGAGGAGGSGSAAAIGGGGGGGAQAITKTIDVVQGQQYDLVFGPSGTAGVGATSGNRGGAGGNGGDSTFTVHGGATLATWAGAGGAAAAGLTGDVRIVSLGGPDNRFTQTDPANSNIVPSYLPPGYGGYVDTSNGIILAGSNNTDGSFAGGTNGAGTGKGVGGGAGATGNGGAGGAGSPGGNGVSGAAGSSAGGGGGGGTANGTGGNGGAGGSAGSLTIRYYA